MPALVLGALLAGVPAHADLVFVGTMSGANEVPPTGSPATGFTIATLTGNQLKVDVTWSGLIGGAAAAAHIHCCTLPGTSIGVAVPFVGFPAAASGTYENTFNLLDPSVYTSSFLTAFGGGTAAGAEAALIAGLNAGEAYSNIHNAVFPGGEIRAFLEPVPEPSSVVLLASGLVFGAALFRRRRLAA